MTIDRTDLPGRATGTQEAKAADSSAPSSPDQLQILRVAQEFESMLLVQMLRDMRRSGSWEEESQEGGLGAAAFSDTIDSELALHLARTKGLGLSGQLLEALKKSAQSGEKTGLGASPAQLSAVGQPSTGVVAPTSEAVVQPVAGGTESTTPVTLSGAARTSGQVTSGFGWRADPFTGAATFHKGIDLRAAYGQDVQAAAPGRVVFSGEQRGYGTTVMIEHADGTRTRYAHLSAAVVPMGAAVAGGQPIGRAGHSGRATGTHVHFEVIDAKGQAIAPDQWVRG